MVTLIVYWGEIREQVSSGGEIIPLPSPCYSPRRSEALLEVRGRYEAAEVEVVDMTPMEEV
jgi:hypothetical protein